MDKRLRASSLLLPFFLYFPSPVIAEDIAADVKNGNRVQQEGGYFELGLLGGYMYNPFELSSFKETEGFEADIDASGVYRKNGFFFEAVFATQDGVNLGYNLWQNEHSSFDLLAGSLSGSYEFDYNDGVNPQDTEAERNEALYHRNTFHTGTGFRFTHYLQNYVIQYRLVTDVLDNNGVISTLRVGRAWQVRNWNMHAIISAIYTSRETNQYWYGVKENEATSAHPAFYPDASIAYSAIFGVTHPLSEKWVIRGLAGWEQTADEIRQSSFVDDHDRIYAGVSISRVFSIGN